MRSTCPFPRGTPAVIKTCSMFSSVQYFRNKLEVNAALRSDTIWRGFPNIIACFDNWFIIFSADVDFVEYNHTSFINNQKVRVTFLNAWNRFQIIYVLNLQWYNMFWDTSQKSFLLSMLLLSENISDTILYNFIYFFTHVRESKFSF